jgi:hypothetical protein
MIPRIGYRQRLGRILSCSLVLALSVSLGALLPAEDGVSRTSEWLRNTPQPIPVEPVPAERIEASMARGIDYLLEDQNPDGSWGSATRTKGLNILAPIPGAHHAFRAAVTSLCLSALIESGDERPEVTESIQRGWIWLARHLPQVRRADQETIYNVWAHAYSIAALVDLHQYFADNPELQLRAIQLVEQQLVMLDRYEGINGGWGYYDFGAHTQQPNAEPTSFTTATALIAMHEAEQLGVKIPERLRQRAVRSLERQMKPDFSYYYSDNGPVSNRPMWEINRPGGSLGRSQACNLALRLWGNKAITDEVLRVWLDRLFARNLWLDIGRKRPIPHESHFLVAGYFFYYGHYYAAQCIEQLPAGERADHQAQLARVLLELQERDGSWWDFPFYDYHQPYGTAMAVMSLVRCRSAEPSDS